MRAIVLVGGFGTRLRPLTLHTPKQMLPLLDRPMIEWVCDWLAGNGITEVVLSLGYRPEAFVDAYPDHRCAGVHLRYAVEPEPLDTAGAIRFAALEAGVEVGAEPFVVVNGDVITDLDVAELIALHRRRGAEGTIALTPVEDPSRYGVVPIDGDGRVEAFIEKPPRDEAPSNWINAGTYVLEPSVIGRIADGRRVSIEREVFPAMVADRTLFALQSHAAWIDAGTPATYLEVQLDLLERRLGAGASFVAPGAVVEPGATVTRSVLLAGSCVTAGATVEGSALGVGSVVAAGAVVRDSVVGTRSRVGAGASLTELTVVGDDVDVPPGTIAQGGRFPSED